jgi:hypothetical protein
MSGISNALNAVIPAWLIGPQSNKPGLLNKSKRIFAQLLKADALVAPLVYTLSQSSRPE